MADSGKGIKIKKGDKFVIPSAFLRLSLAPGGPGKLFRGGIGFLVQQFMLSNSPSKPEDLPKTLEKCQEEADLILKKSSLFEGLDLESEVDGPKVWEKLKDRKDLREFYAMMLGSTSIAAREALEAGETAKAAWLSYLAASSHAMTVVKEPVFEETLWRGYLANQVVHESAAAGARTSAEADAIRNLQPHFERLDEAALYSLANSGEPIGPRIGVKEISESVLKSLAGFHLSVRQRKRDEAKDAWERKKETRNQRIQWLSVGVAIGTLLLAVIQWLFTALRPAA